MSEKNSFQNQESSELQTENQDEMVSTLTIIQKRQQFQDKENNNFYTFQQETDGDENLPFKFQKQKTQKFNRNFQHQTTCHFQGKKEIQETSQHGASIRRDMFEDNNRMISLGGDASLSLNQDLVDISYYGNKNNSNNTANNSLLLQNQLSKKESAQYQTESQPIFDPEQELADRRDTKKSVSSYGKSPNAQNSSNLMITISQQPSAQKHNLFKSIKVATTKINIEKPSYIKEKQHTKIDQLLKPIFFLIFHWCKKSLDSNYVLSPMKGSVIGIQVMFMLIMLYNFIEIPINISYFSPETEWLSWSNICFVIEIIFNLNVGYYYEGSLITDRKQIAKNYLKKSFILDFIAIVSKNIACFEDISAILLNQYIQIVRLLYYLRIKRLSIYGNCLDDHYNIRSRSLALWELGKLLIIISCVASFVGCGFHFVGEKQQIGNSWLDVHDLREASWQHKYLKSVYFACITMVTVGYGDVSPVGNTEIIYVIFVTFFSTAIFAYAVNIIGAILNQEVVKRQKFKRQQYLITKYMVERKISRELQISLIKHLEYKEIMQEQSHENGLNILQLCSKDLQKEFMMEFFGSILRKTKLFSLNFSPTFLKKVSVTSMEEKMFHPGEVIVKQNEQLSKLFIITNGVVEIMEKQSIIGSIDRGQIIGYPSFFGGISCNFVAKCKHTVSAVQIDLGQFLNLLKDYPLDFQKYCHIRDNINIYKNYVGQMCYSCGDYQHQHGECPYINLYVNRTLLLKRYDISIPQERENIQRRVQKIHNSKKSKGKVYFDAISIKLSIFRKLNMEQDEIQLIQDILDNYELLKNYHYLHLYLPKLKQNEAFYDLDSAEDDSFVLEQLDENEKKTKEIFDQMQDLDFQTESSGSDDRSQSKSINLSKKNDHSQYEFKEEDEEEDEDQDLSGTYTEENWKKQKKNSNTKSLNQISHSGFHSHSSFNNIMEKNQNVDATGNAQKNSSENMMMNYLQNRQQSCGLGATKLTGSCNDIDENQSQQSSKKNTFNISNNNNTNNATKDWKHKKREQCLNRLKSQKSLREQKSLKHQASEHENNNQASNIFVIQERSGVSSEKKNSTLGNSIQDFQVNSQQQTLNQLQQSDTEYATQKQRSKNADSNKNKKRKNRQSLSNIGPDGPRKSNSNNQQMQQKEQWRRKLDKVKTRHMSICFGASYQSNLSKIQQQQQQQQQQEQRNSQDSGNPPGSIRRQLRAMSISHNIHGLQPKMMEQLQSSSQQPHQQIHQSQSLPVQQQQQQQAILQQEIVEENHIFRFEFDLPFNFQMYFPHNNLEVVVEKMANYQKKMIQNTGTDKKKIRIKNSFQTVKKGQQQIKQRESVRYSQLNIKPFNERQAGKKSTFVQQPKQHAYADNHLRPYSCTDQFQINQKQLNEQK